MSVQDILIIDDDIRICRMLTDVFNEHGIASIAVYNGSEGIKAVSEVNPAVALLDLRLPDMDGMEVLKKIKMINLKLPVIIISAHGDIKAAVESIKAGAFDFLEKPISTDRLMLTVNHAFEQRHLRDQVEKLETEAYQYYKILGNSAAINKVFKLIDRAADVKSHVLITGENGTGKELAAKGVHYKSSRKTNPFIKINCAAIPETLLESELFGYEKGAFTGAAAAKKGKLEAAHLGTVFLDEIGDMSPATQAKLLRFLQDGEIEKIGAINQRNIDVRIIAATNQNLEVAVKEKRFREDLFYRLNVIFIKMPPLRERKDDIPTLAKYFLAEYCLQNGMVEKVLTNEALVYLANQEWPGNVRQLKNIMERVVALIDRQVIEPVDIESVIKTEHNYTTDLTVPLDFQSAKSRFEKEYIIGILNDHNWNIPQTANYLGMDRANLYRKMKKLGIDDRCKGMV